MSWSESEWALLMTTLLATRLAEAETGLWDCTSALHPGTRIRHTFGADAEGPESPSSSDGISSKSPEKTRSYVVSYATICKSAAAARRTAAAITSSFALINAALALAFGIPISRSCCMLAAEAAMLPWQGLQVSSMGE
jgi:hypothetical protein